MNRRFTREFHGSSALEEILGYSERVHVTCYTMYTSTGAPDTKLFHRELLDRSALSTTRSVEFVGYFIFYFF